jgi:hypothetical protein
MTIILELKPEIEKGLLAQAHLRGVSLTEFAQQILAREANVAEAEPTPPPERTGQAFIDAFAEIRGILTDEEIDTMFARNRSPSRPVNFE